MNSDNNDIIFNEDDESDFEVNGYMVKGFHLPENTAVVLSVGKGTHYPDTPYIVRLGVTWDDVQNFTIEAADILAYSRYDQVSVRFVEGKHWVTGYPNYPVNTPLLEEIRREIDENFPGI